MALLDIEVNDISITEAAAQAVKELLAKKELTGYGLRVYIGGGGCSGYQYGMALDNNFRESDFISEQHGVNVVIDEMSMNYLRGSTIDYVDELMGSGFRIENPNAVASCGCGHSFRTSEEAGAAEASGGSCC